MLWQYFAAWFAGVAASGFSFGRGNIEVVFSFGQTEACKGEALNIEKLCLLRVIYGPMVLVVISGC